MLEILNEDHFDFICTADKAFITAFDDALTRLGYSFGGQIGSGYCWGRYMLIYRKAGVKSQQVNARVYARIYLREGGIVLRLFLNDVDRHRAFIEGAPAHIKDVFTGSYGDCTHCHNEKDGRCRFRKSYTLDGRLIEKCNGITFEFRQPNIQHLPDFLALFTEFYPEKKTRRPR